MLTMAIDLSEDARELLLEASRDPAGLILKLTSMGGSAFLKSNGRTFGDETPDGQARWESAIRHLLRLGLIESGGDWDQVFCVTQGGHQVADDLRRR